MLTEKEIAKLTLSKEILALLRPTVEEKAAQIITETVTNNAKTIFRGAANSVAIFNKTQDYIDKALDELSRKELIAKSHILEESMSNFLSKYTKTKEEADKIAKQITDEYKTEQSTKNSSFEVRKKLEKLASEQLEQLKGKKKSAQKMDFMFAFSEVLTNYASPIEDKHRDLAINARILFENSLEPISEDLIAQFEVIVKYENELLHLLEEAVVPVRKEIKDWYKEKDHQLKLDYIFKNWSREEFFKQTVNLKVEAQKKASPLLNKAMDKVIEQWAPKQPVAVINNMDLKLAKMMVGLSISLSDTTESLDELGKTLSQPFSEREIKEYQKNIRNFMIQLKENNLSLLASQPLPDMDVEDIRMKEAVDYLQIIVQTLPKETQKQLLDEKCSVEDVKKFDFSACEPNRLSNNLFYDNTIIPKAIKYNELLKKHLKVISQQTKQQDAKKAHQELIELHDKPKINPFMVKSLLDTIQHEATDRFNVILRKANEITLDEVSKQLSSINLGNKTEVQTQLLTQLQSRIQSFKDLSDIKLSNAATIPFFSPTNKNASVQTQQNKDNKRVEMKK